MFKRFDARRQGVALAAGVFLALGYVAPVAAFNFGDMMNPGKWFGGNSRNYDDYGPYGYDVPPPPLPGYGYGAPGYGYAVPGYGYGAPAYALPPAGQPYGYTAPAAPATAASAKKSENDADTKIRKLEQRIQELEANAAHPAVQNVPPAYQDQSPYPAQPYQTQPPYPSNPYPEASGLTFRPTE